MMKISLCAFLAGIVSLNVLGLSAFAEDKPKPSPEERFKKLDKDSDGSLTLEEFKGKAEGEKATKAEDRFKKLDKDSDGKLTLEEFKAGAGKKKS